METLVMSDHIHGEGLNISHEDVEVEICVNGICEVFSTANTAVWIYPPKYQAFNNIIREEDDDSYCRWFSPDQETLDLLHEAGITHVYPPYPSRETVLGFWAIEMAHFDNELTYIFRTGEMPQ